MAWQRGPSLGKAEDQAIRTAEGTWGPANAERQETHVVDERVGSTVRYNGPCPVRKPNLRGRGVLVIGEPAEKSGARHETAIAVREPVTIDGWRRRWRPASN